jgi:hypothetical protein
MSAEKEQKIRRARRVDLQCRLDFSSGDIAGEAHVTNLSTAGCRAESEINVAEGLEFHLLIRLPDQSPPIKVERAAVRWLSGNAFGLSFILFLPSERARLQTFLATIK